MDKPQEDLGLVGNHNRIVANLEADLKAAKEEIDQWKRAFTLRQDEVAVLRAALEEERTNARDLLLQAKRELDGLKERIQHMEAQLTAEEQCAMESGGILSDVCDLVFDDPERAATHGYEGVINKVVDMKNRLRLYQLGVSKHCADFCTEVKDGLGPCFTCPLGKL